MREGDARAPAIRNGAATFGDIAGKITMLEVACSRCKRRGGREE
jgi:hypothetical protein